METINTTKNKPLRKKDVAKQFAWTHFIRKLVFFDTWDTHWGTGHLLKVEHDQLHIKSTRTQKILVKDMRNCVLANKKWKSSFASISQKFKNNKETLIDHT